MSARTEQPPARAQGSAESDTHANQGHERCQGRVDKRYGSLLVPPIGGTSHSHCEVRDRRALAAFPLVGSLEALDHPARGQVVANDLTEDAGALAVDDPDAGHAG